MTVFNTPEDLIKATLAKVNPQVVMVPTIGEQMERLIQPGRAVGFRTESGSLYELTCYVNQPTSLIKVDEETDGIREIAKGKLLGAHDRKRGVYGVRIEEPSGRTYTTSAVVKIWLAFDATVEGPGAFHKEPDQVV